MGQQPPAQIQDFHLRDALAVLQHILQLDGEERSAFFPQGFQDTRPTLITALPATPPKGRVRAFMVDELLQIMDDSGGLGAVAEMISTDSNGIRRIVPPGSPGAILVRDPSQATGVVWADVLAVSEISGQHQAGSVFNYSSLASVAAAEIQYTRVFLAKDLELANMQVFRGAGGSGARLINLGVYDQASPLSTSDQPRTRLIETTAQVTTGTGPNEYLSFALSGGPLVIPSTGFYWLAFISDTATPVTFNATPGVYPQDFLPIFREVSAGTTLPGTASGLTNPASAVAFVAALE